MDWKPKIAVGSWVVGSQADRFVPKGYRDFVSPEEKIRRVGSINNVSGIELTYPVDFTTMEKNDVAAAVSNAGLKVSDIGVNIFSNPIFKHGSITNLNKEIRKKAMDICYQAIEAARAVKSPGLRMWMGQDGFDYPFQANYENLWDLMLASLKELAEAAPDLKFGLEYKLREPRNKSLIDSISKALLISLELDLPNVGVVVDFGHALMGKENAAESVYQALRYNKLFTVHFNDAYGDWDDDMIPGTLNIFETLEFLYYLQEYNYSNWLTLDSFPFREDPVKAVDLSIRNILELTNMLEKIDIKKLRAAQETMDAVNVLEVTRGAIFKN